MRAGMFALAATLVACGSPATNPNPNPTPDGGVTTSDGGHPINDAAIVYDGSAIAFSMPTVDDERNTYKSWGWTWDESTANAAYDSANGYSISSPDIHGDTESDDVWDYLEAYDRRTSGRDGYLQRAKAWRDYYVNSFEGSPEQNNDESFLADHFYGWGLMQYGARFNDSAAVAEAVKIAGTVHDIWAQRENGGWPTPGSFDIAHYGMRGPARNLHLAVIVADATGDAKAVELRDHLIDLWLASPDWDAAQGMYWVSDEQMGYYNLTPPDGPLSYAAGDRAVSSFHVGQLAEAFFAAWLSPNVAQSKKDALRARIVAMATWVRANGLDPTYRYSSDTFGIRGSGGAWWNYSLGPVSFWDGVYTVSLVNVLVLGYKFTGDVSFLSGPASNGLYPAQYAFNRGIKNIYGSTTDRECADDVVGHFVDTRFDTSTGNEYLYNNKGELQYTYLIFENGGNPTVFP